MWMRPWSVWQLMIPSPLLLWRTKGSCHFIDESTSLQSVVLGVLHFPEAHTAESLAKVKAALMSEWGITQKVTCLVTDGAANMGVCAKELCLRHTNCVVHTLNFLIKKAVDQNTVLSDIRANSRKIVGYFKSSTTAKVSYFVSLQESK